MKIFYSLLVLFASALSAAGQQISEQKESKWHHFKKHEFKLDGTPAWFVEPQYPLAGKPWVWRAHFPSWHTQMDSILLERGFHIAYINTNNLYGHPKALTQWDKFYKYLTESKGFSSKVALEGVSRGGLYVYGWAKRNPGKVSCIYAEAPVCDFKSWPAGKGKGKGSVNDWKKLLEVYGFTDQEALNYIDQPKDNLDGLAAFKVPLLHAIGLNDSIVPNAENTFVLVANYIQKGGPASITPMTIGEHKLDGHHFPIEKPQQITDFIFRNSFPVLQTLKSANFIQGSGNLDNFKFRLENQKKATVAFLGGSITNMSGWRNKTEQYLKEAYPEVQFTFINAGIPSLGSVAHAFRLKTDVLDKGRIDLMFIESAVNDRVNGTSERQQQRALEGLIRQAYAANPYINMVMMAFADEKKLSDFKIGKIPAEVKLHQDLSEKYKLHFINLAAEVYRRIEAEEFTWKDDFKDLHPSPFGQEIYFATLKTLLQQEVLFAEKVKRLSPVKLPALADRFNYSKGEYLDVGQAKNRRAFSIISNWSPEDNYPARPGFYNRTVLAGDKPGASFELLFKGTAIGIALNSGPDAGMIEYSIDGGSKKTIDLYTPWSKSLHLPWYLILADGLRDTKHTLHFNILDQKNISSKGNACRIVHFLTN